MNLIAQMKFPSEKCAADLADRGTSAADNALWRVVAVLGAVILAAGCATAPMTSRTTAATDAMERGGVFRSLTLDPGVEERILALDPERVSDDDVRSALAKGPTPRIILLHGGIYPVHLIMKSFGVFLQRMGYPAEKLRDPVDGAYSQSPYGSSDRLTGEIAWYYEHDGVRAMMIGHSQGGVQAIKVLYELEGDFGSEIAVWNPMADAPEGRFTITDPITGNTRPVVGISVAYVSAVGAGGAALLLPNQWNMARRSRTIPDTVDEFTGYIIPGDLIAWTLAGATGANRYQHDGAVKVRNVTLPFSYNHITVPLTSSLASDDRAREWINSYRPAGGEEEVLNVPPDVKGENIVWAADVWFSVKKHWCLEAQQLLRARRAALAAR